MTRCLPLLAVLLALTATVARAELAWAAEDGDAAGPHLIISGGSAGGYAGAFLSTADGNGLVGADLRVFEFRWFSKQGLLLGARLIDLGEARSGYWDPVFTLSVGKLLSTRGRSFSYGAFSVDPYLSWLALEYVFVPFAPWPVEVGGRVAFLTGRSALSGPYPMQFHALVGGRVGLGWWVMREDEANWESREVRTYLSALSLGGHAGAFTSGQAIGFVGADLRLLEYRRVLPSGFVFGFSALEIGVAAQGASFTVAMISVGHTIHSGTGSFGYAAFAAGLGGAFVEYVYAPRPPWPFELSARVGGAIGPDPMEFPDPTLHARASVGVRAGVGRWWTQ